MFPNGKNIDKGKLIADLDIWEWWMRLREYICKEKEVDSVNECKTKKKQSLWIPNAGRDKCLDKYSQAVKNDIISGLKRNFKMNLTREEEMAMKTLLNDSSIIIRPADKGSGIVIMNTEDYTNKLENEMKDNGTYAEVAEDKTKKIENKVKKLIKQIRNDRMITGDLKSYLMPSGGRSVRLQCNPKRLRDYTAPNHCEWKEPSNRKNGRSS